MITISHIPTTFTRPPVDPILDAAVRALRENPGPPLARRPYGVIGLAGPADVGKDTTADILTTYAAAQNMPAVKESFANPLYASIAAATGIPIEVLRDRRYKDLRIDWPGAPRGLAHLTPRKILQRIGTEGFRDRIAPQFWIDRMRDRTEHWLRTAEGAQASAEHSSLPSIYSGAIVIISDVRFDNEAEVCDVVIELMRESVAYRDDYISERRISAHLIDATIMLKAYQSPQWLGQAIINTLVRKQEQRAAAAR